MLRRLFLWLSARRSIFRLAKRNGLARRVATRFVAGETVADAVAVARRMNGDGIRVSLDLLGESVTNSDESERARDEVLATLHAIHDAGVDGNISIKLTQMGLDVAHDLCVNNLRAILRQAEAYDTFVRVDMEGSAYTERTLELYHDVLHPEFGSLTGVVIQSYLRRSTEDVERLLEVGARVRLCKGAYAEPPEIAFQSRQEVDASYVSLMERLLTCGNYPAIATHDPRLIAHATDYVARHDIAPDRFEFQMLYGVRRDLQRDLARRGYNVRVYIPFGTAWYPYLMRRLAERPANVASMTFSLAREAFARR